MAYRLVAADASPLIGLAKAGSFNLLREMFQTITVTDVVRDEVCVRNDLPGATELMQAVNAGWVEVVRQDAEASSLLGLGPGESSTLSLAKAHDGDRLVIMDERSGRSEAKRLGIPVIGVAGLLLEAKTSGIVAEVKPILDTLMQEEFRLDPRIVRSILEAAGE